MSRYVDIECDSVTEILNRRAFKSREDIQDFLDSIPTVDVEPIKHGYWIESFHLIPQYKCSECDGYINGELYYDYINETMHYPKYCEHCGAKMDAENVSKLSFKEMRNVLDEAYDKLITVSYSDLAVREAKRMIEKVNSSLCEWEISLEKEKLL